MAKICKISVEDSFKVMIEAHTKGKAVAKTGNYDEIYSMKDALNKLNLEATVEK
jgi:ATP-dependent Clp protease adapter protein ClpS